MTKIKIITAKALSAAELKKIEDRFCTVLNDDELDVEVEIDASLIGGICVESGGELYDGSVRTRIENMKKAMLSEE